ncbi:FkbM family methyltransferase [Aporhodopirellula aestuarii]|uniref:FkbM family methyltransferase n=1 Tax=Aporhodopirellula aestuarii TaxID=2950107 RepID=A0ABT0U5Q5_9BACT|nr:FkbM family methyltransferase [Aporhodopirellula aestuarii]MCM2372210.1 FkbM family methyltransferase [Aporhodopirellula aestuarii]
MARFRQLRRRLFPGCPTGTDVKRMRARLLRRIGLARSREPRIMVDQPDLHYGSVLSLAIAEQVIQTGHLTFLQVGAFDGAQNDEILHIVNRFPVKGILIEPQPNVYKRLQDLHGDNENLILVNAAIDKVSGSRPFYMLDGGDLECASFDRNHLIKHGVEPGQIYSENVQCLTLHEVLENANIDSVDLLQIDAEGYDYEIIKTIDFTRLTPKILRFEYRHLSNDDVDECLEMLSQYGYRFIVEELDLIAIRKVSATTQSESSVNRRAA